MSEVLLLRVLSDASSTLRWWRVQPALSEIRAQGESASLAELATTEPDLRLLPVWLLLPGQWFSLNSCALPAARDRQLLRLLPALLEDDLAQDIDTLHFALVHRDHDIGQVAVIERSVLRHWCETTASNGFTLQALWPDWMALPLSASFNAAAPDACDSSITVLNGAHSVLARRVDGHKLQAWRGGSAEPLWALPLLMALGTSVNTEAPMVGTSATTPDMSSPPSGVISRVIWYGIAPGAELVAALGIPAPTVMPNTDDEGPLLLAGAVELQREQRHGVLVGEFAPRRAQSSQWRQWRSMALAVSLFVLLLFGEQGVRWWQLTREADQVVAQAEQAYSAVFPQQKRRVNMRAQLNAVLRQMRGQPPLQGLAPYLRKVALALQEPTLSRQPLQLKSLQYQRDQQSLRLQVQAAGFPELEQLRTALGRSFQVEQGALSRDGAGVSGSLLLRDNRAANQGAASERQTRTSRAP